VIFVGIESEFDPWLVWLWHYSSLLTWLVRDVGLALHCFKFTEFNKLCLGTHLEHLLGLQLIIPVTNELIDILNRPFRDIRLWECIFLLVWVAPKILLAILIYFSLALKVIQGMIRGCVLFEIDRPIHLSVLFDLVFLVFHVFLSLCILIVYSLPLFFHDQSFLLEALLLTIVPWFFVLSDLLVDKLTLFQGLALFA